MNPATFVCFLMTVYGVGSSLNYGFRHLPKKIPIICT